MNAIEYIALSDFLPTAGFTDAAETDTYPDGTVYATWRTVTEFGPVEVSLVLRPAGTDGVSTASMTLWDEHIETERNVQVREADRDGIVGWVGSVLTMFRAVAA